jgi:hypothetical protein
MKTLFLTCLCVFVLAWSAFSQTPTATIATSPASALTPVASPAISPTAPTDLADKIHRRIDKKLQQKGLHFSVTDDDETDGVHHGEVPGEVIPIVAIVMMAVFGAPVLIVAVILYFTFSRNRMMHKTIRMMVEKGQPVPAALLAPPAPAQRQRSDMRRGIVLVMVGVGIMLFLGAVNDWEGGAWAIGIIPFLIGTGYLLVWKMEGGQKAAPDNPPPLP